MTEQVSEPERLFGEERRWCDRRNRAVAAAAESQGTAGAALLAGGEGAMQEQVGTLTRLRAEADACDAAIVEARRQRVDAIRDVWLAEAADLRVEAKGLEDEASTRDTKTARLLKALEDWEGCHYVPEPPPEVGMHGDLGGGAPAVVYVRIPQTQGLRHQAELLRSEADALEARKVVTAGSLPASDRDEVLLLVGGWDPMKLGPSLIAVEDWLQENEPPALERLARLPAPAVALEAPLSYTLAWQAGEIDARRSRIAPIEG